MKTQLRERRETFETREAGGRAKKKSPGTLPPERRTRSFLQATRVLLPLNVVPLHRFPLSTPLALSGFQHRRRASGAISIRENGPAKWAFRRVSLGHKY